MESTDKLRGYISAFVTGSMETDLLDFADEIEQEIAERYMELPVDVDGVPIHYGDSLAYCGEHGETVTGKVGNMEYRERSYGEADWLVNVAGWIFPGDACHVEPRTIEDVLEEFLIEFDDWDWNTGGNDRDNARKQLFAKYADELRNMGVGE